MITLKDIAKHCGVSISTVSYALSNNSTISEKTKAKILQAAKDLKYTPNSNAQSLKRKSTHKIGVFVPGFQGSIHPTILAGIARVLRDISVHYNMIVTFTDEDMLFIKNRSVDLAIIMDGKTTEETIRELATHVPIITFDQNTTGQNIYNTYVDNFTAMHSLTEMLMNKGCKRIGFIQGSIASYHNKIRFDGYKTALIEHNLSLDDKIVYNANAFTIYKGHQVIFESLKGLKALPFDALICCNDELAIGALDALKEYGYEAPKDFLITGFDDIEKTVFMKPSLTTVHVDWFNYGIKIAELALEILRGNEPTKSFSISAEIIERESTSK